MRYDEPNNRPKRYKRTETYQSYLRSTQQTKPLVLKRLENMIVMIAQSLLI